MKKVKVLRSFVARTGGGTVRGVVGDVIDMPDDADWLPAGFVELVEADEAATEKRAPRKRTAKKKAG